MAEVSLEKAPVTEGTRRCPERDSSAAAAPLIADLIDAI